MELIIRESIMYEINTFLKNVKTIYNIDHRRPKSNKNAKKKKIKILELISAKANRYFINPFDKMPGFYTLHINDVEYILNDSNIVCKKIGKKGVVEELNKDDYLILKDKNVDFEMKIN